MPSRFRRYDILRELNKYVLAYDCNTEILKSQADYKHIG